MRQVGARLPRCGAVTPGPPQSGPRGWGPESPTPPQRSLSRAGRGAADFAPGGMTVWMGALPLS